ncbi:hypothetical protein E4U43_002560 [Claviceps pusilla]|uniref:Zn(2)-C6 fungal-type domain-containing protein n=1 Tax=Claviceps pusilla TaxID=123648 RepID=A0A9P7SV70_9HYPO|nr:hypothetical protein E4U43_002560 [Claviceps pusilla]
MAQRQYAAGTSASSPSVSAASAGGKHSHPPASSSATTPAHQRQEQDEDQELGQAHGLGQGQQQQQQQEQEQELGQFQQQNQSRSHSRSHSHAQLSAGQHKRVYQACIPCRRRKVRCDLGSVDNPHDPPCVRCRRESKECFFSATRRKRKTDDAEGSDADEYVVRNGRKRLHADTSPPPPQVDPRFCSDAPLTPGGSHGRSQPLRRPDARSRSRRDSEFDGDGDAKLENIEAQTAMRRAVYNPHDALDLLYKAATDRSAVESSGQTNISSDFISPAANTHVREESIASATTVVAAHQLTPQEAVTVTSFSRPRSMSNRLDFEQQQNQQQQHLDQQQQHQQRHQQQHHQQQQHQRRQQHLQHQQHQQHHHQQQQQQEQEQEGAQRHFLDNPPRPVPHHTVESGLAQQSAMRDQPGYAQALRAWSRFRFVRAGWFTAQEAIEYIDYYYKFLSPMTPISPPTFSDPASHLTLLTEEPILTVTLLTISSRYRQMPGTGGHCRSHAIPEQLWTYLRGMIERCLWGQEAFGGGFCGSGGPGSSSMTAEDEADTSSTAPWRGMRKGSLRTLGTIESLLILTEWHPRALHFPPQEAIDELMLPDYNSGPTTSSDDSSRNVGAGFGGKRIESWLEPAWRSDRMCWMLLSTAMGLAYELGVFDDIDEMLRDDTITRPEYLNESYRTRANRIKRLLLIYTSQLAGRLGWTSMTPEHLRKADPAVTRRRPVVTTEGGNTPSTTASMGIGFNYVPDLELDDQIIHCWAGISNAMHIGNEKLFKSRKYTTEIIQSGKYVELLREYSPLLKDWYREFELFRLPQFIRHILTIEYEYVRIYVNSLSLQAVVERCTSNAGHSANGNNSNHETNNNNSSNNGGNGQATHGTTHLSPQTLINYGKLPLGQLGGFTVHDQEYVREVVDGCRNLLRTVVDGLLPGGYLKHAPVRTYFRIISGAMFLLKTFALGAPRSDVKMSIDLMDACVEALRNCVVDDVHLGIRFADLLETLTSRLRNRFIQAPTMQQSAGRDQSPLAEGNRPGGIAAADTANWVGKHAQKLRDGLNGQYRPSSPQAEGSNNNNISATPFDLSMGNFHYLGASSMGPSTPAAHVDHNGAAALPGVDMHLFDEWNNPGNEMWYLPTGPAFFQNMGDSSVAMTAEGVNVGGLDLLEYMAMDPVQFSSIDGPASVGGGNGGN